MKQTLKVKAVLGLPLGIQMTLSKSLTNYSLDQIDHPSSDSFTGQGTVVPFMTPQKIRLLESLPHLSDQHRQLHHCRALQML